MKIACCSISYIPKVLLSVCLGLGVTLFLYEREFNLGQVILIPFTFVEVLSVVLAILFMAMKDFAFTLRYRMMCRPSLLSWKGAIRTNYLCEFTSAVTPSAVGGSALIMAYLYREGITVGRGVAVMISTLFLDELLFVLVTPVCLMLFPSSELFNLPMGLSSGLRYAFASVYILIVLYVGLLYVALFKRPDLIQKILMKLVKLPLLHRYESAAQHFTEDLAVSGTEMKSQSFYFWIKVFALTVWGWLSRYAVACVLFMPFIPSGKQLLVLCRQLVLWIVMMIAPTPGGSGVSEYLFTQYYSDLSVSAGEILFITCFWRILTYYIYLFVGFSILPSWMKKAKQCTL